MWHKEDYTFFNAIKKQNKSYFIKRCTNENS